jgi:hypothetical protein
MLSPDSLFKEFWRPLVAVEKDLQILLEVQHFGPEISKRHIVAVQTFP